MTRFDPLYQDWSLLYLINHRPRTLPRSCGLTITLRRRVLNLKVSLGSALILSNSVTLLNGTETEFYSFQVGFNLLSLSRDT